MDLFLVAIFFAQQALAGRREASEKELDGTRQHFLEAVSHELKTPLTSIRGYVELLIGGRLGPLTDRQRRALEVVQRAVRREERLVDDLLCLARFEAGAVDREVFDLREAAALVRESFAAGASRRGIALAFELPSDAVLVRADRAGIALVLSHLVDEALAASPRGRVEVAIASTGSSARVSVSRSGSRGALGARLERVLEALHVSISAGEDPDGAARLAFSLPLVAAPVAAA